MLFMFCLWSFPQVEVNRCSRVQCVVEQAASSVYMDSRSVTLRATFSLGRYVVLPTTFLPGATGRFLLRLFSHSHIQLRCERQSSKSQLFISGTAWNTIKKIK